MSNRPFLECLDGFGRCAWRQGRWAEAEQIFTTIMWLAPATADDAVDCLEAVLARRRWTKRPL